MSLFHIFKKMKHWYLDIIDYGVFGEGCKIEKDLELSPSPANCSSKGFPKIIVLVYNYLLTKFGDLMSCGSKDNSEMHPVSCFNTHHDVTELVNHRMVENTKTWISWEQNITFLWNKKILNLCLKWHILRSYRFLAEATFKHFSY